MIKIWTFLCPQISCQCPSLNAFLVLLSILNQIYPEARKFERGEEIEVSLFQYLLLQETAFGKGSSFLVLLYIYTVFFLSYDKAAPLNRLKGQKQSRNLKKSFMSFVIARIICDILEQKRYR